MKQSDRVGDFERNLHRLQTENRRLREEKLKESFKIKEIQQFESVYGHLQQINLQRASLYGPPI